MPAPDIDFGHYLDLKYQNQGMQARAAQTEANARAGLLNQQTAQVAANDASSRLVNTNNNNLTRVQAASLAAKTPGDIGLTTAQTNLYRQQGIGLEGINSLGGLSDIYGSYILHHPENAGAVDDVLNAPAYKEFRDSFAPVPLFGPRAGGTGLPVANTVETRPVAAGFSRVTKVGPNGDSSFKDVPIKKDDTRLGFKRGIARVPGKGNGMKDTVKAKLAPGEAVLNKAAADHMGRGLIGALNKAGAQRMSMT